MKDTTLRQEIQQAVIADNRNIDRTNARHLNAGQVPEPVDLIVCDAAFIGLETILPAPLALAAPGAHLVALIKPQFEVGKKRVGKGGVVRDPALHEEVRDRIEAWLAARPGWRVLGRAESPVLGPKGNREFLIAGERGAKSSAESDAPDNRSC